MSNVYDADPQRNLDAAREVAHNARQAGMAPHEADVLAVLGGLPGTNGAALRQAVSQAAAIRQSPAVGLARWSSILRSPMPVLAARSRSMHGINRSERLPVVSAIRRPSGKPPETHIPEGLIPATDTFQVCLTQVTSTPERSSRT